MGFGCAVGVRAALVLRGSLLVAAVIFLLALLLDALQALLFDQGEDLLRKRVEPLSGSLICTFKTMED